MKLVSSISNFKSILSSLSPQIRRHRIDILIAFAFVIVGGVTSYLGAQLIDPIIVKVWDSWFGGVIPRVFDNMTSRGSNHYRLKVHPLFSLLILTKFVFAVLTRNQVNWDIQHLTICLHSTLSSKCGENSEIGKPKTLSPKGAHNPLESDGKVIDLKLFVS